MNRAAPLPDRQDAEHLTYPDGSFDVVIVHAGLHHCYSPHRALGEMLRVAWRAALVFEARDSFLLNVAKRLGFTMDYEVESVSGACKPAALRRDIRYARPRAGDRARSPHHAGARASLRIKQRAGNGHSTIRYRCPAGASITLLDAGIYINELPKADQQLDEWQTAIECLMLVVKLGGPTMFARIGMLRALNRNTERVFNPDRKDTRWGKRKLARDR